MSTLQTPLTLPERPVSPVRQDCPDVRAIDRFGKHWLMVRFEDRSATMQERIEAALRSFRTFRKNRGEPLDCAVSVWEMPPPDPETLQVYLAATKHSSRGWRDAVVAALRLYCLEIDNPQLFRLVEVRLAKH